ncbi:T9SS type A sorting domain-containing protein [Hymenobacter sp. HMF4947]|uniref:T9SS type A sorting domain-containing protein n=1 Tax=Hymenobacter ginkgonis TaxID=2682976 RepID=A0A7K1TCD1_9BACT|nr:T9SS type A sorting domain-containing protein [Hymenobacter ginkgonis]MVN76066.1 T9SS type A sorting domain-containing protein [Hymenobacter ginkgonis]
MLGQQIGQQPLNLGTGATTQLLELANGLAAGVYLLQVQQGSQQQTLKLVRQ